MHILLSLILLLFVLKLGWNVTIPLTLLRRRREGAPPSTGVSIMVELEMALLLVAWLVTLLSSPLVPWLAPTRLVLAGIGLIVGSYAIAFGVAAILVRVVPKPKSRG
jgi:hypothetical protein